MNTPKAQHFIPRFLLKNFCFKHNKNNHFIWTIPKNGEKRNSNIKSIGFENYFYGKDGFLEEIFSRHEGNWSETLNAIKKHDMKFENEQITEISDIIWFLLFRTRSTRNNISELNDNFLNVSKNIATKKSSRFQKNYPYQHMVEYAKKHLQENFYSKTEQHKILSHLRKKLKNEKNINFIQERLANAIEIAADLTPKMIPDAHNESFISEDNESWNSPEWFRNIYWTKIHLTHDHFILSDSIVLATNNEGCYGHILKFGINFDKIFFPVTPNIILVGCKNSKTITLPDNINEKLASVSNKEFYSIYNNETTINEYKKLIGNLKIIEEEEIKKNLTYGGKFGWRFSK